MGFELGIIIPSIDLIDNQVVRLYQGNYFMKSVYSENPINTAKTFQDIGATMLHVIDLDAARTGNLKNNFEVIKKISEIIPIQVGGGIRNSKMVEKYLNFAKRIILGTVAVENPKFVSEMVEIYGKDRIAVAVDVSNEQVVTHGWHKKSKLCYLEFINNLECEIVIVTDISRDGTLSSPNWSLLKGIKNKKIIVSGGVSKIEDLNNPYYATIVGKAYYEGMIDLKKCLKKG